MDCPPEDQVKVLRWVAGRHQQDGATLLWDSDLMSAFAWTQEKAQSMLAGLRANGDLSCKDVLLEGGGGYSMGSIRLTEAGHDRLAAEEPQGTAAQGILGRLARLVAARRAR
ncbi:MAG TPA: hypothetical protein VM286_09985 [Candidatus Thermoplasmatota archaeon]|nr:hypothetical protein [Candidatus Thermoplasmatota archaeon]